MLRSGSMENILLTAISVVFVVDLFFIGFILGGKDNSQLFKQFSVMADELEKPSRIERIPSQSLPGFLTKPIPKESSSNMPAEVLELKVSSESPQETISILSQVNDSDSVTKAPINIQTPSPSPSPSPTQQAKNQYPIHKNITSTVFWVGEESSAVNGFIHNSASAWDSYWEEHFGGVDSPIDRNGYLPNFLPKENPFYVALPYNDLEDGQRKQSALDLVYWADQKKWSSRESMLKNQWVKISKGDRIVYAQWEDVGPFESDDYKYVFGTSKPSNNENSGVGIDVSPAVQTYLKLKDMDQVNWQFVSEQEVPAGPWKDIVTKSQISY